MKAATAARLAVLAIGVFVALVGPASAVAAPPTIESQWVTGVTEYNAVLHATINPNGTLTQYKLQFDESGAYHFYQPDCGVLHVPGLAYCQHVTPGDERIEPPEGSIPAGSDAVEVSVDLASIGATVEPNTTYHYRAIAANGAPEVEGPDQTFTTPPVGASPPSIIGESVSNVTAHDATLSAQINTNGLNTTYQFRLASGCPLFGNEICPTICPVPPGTCGGHVEIPLPSGVIPASSEAQTVSLDLNAVGITLDPAERYGYAVEATNSAGPTVKGPAQTFMTPAQSPPVSGPPSIESESATGVTESDATLHADINPNGVLTMYKLQIDTTGNFNFDQNDTCVLHPPGVGCGQVMIPGDPLPSGLVEPPESSLPAGAESQHVSVSLASIGATLQPGTTYHYRAIAASGASVIAGPDQTFTTPSPDSPDATPLGQPPVGSAALASSPAINPAPSVSHPRRGKHKRHHHRRHNLEPEREPTSSEAPGRRS